MIESFDTECSSCVHVDERGFCSAMNRHIDNMIDEQCDLYIETETGEQMRYLQEFIDEKSHAGYTLRTSCN